MKKWLFYYFLAGIWILNANSYAEDLGIYKLSTSAVELEGPGETLSWQAVTDEQVANAACKTKTLPTSLEMQKYYRDITSSKKDAVIHGVFFKEESEHLLRAFEDFTTSLDIFGIERKIDNQRNIDLVYNVNPGCNKVICALEKIWGSKSVVEKMLYIYFRYNFNTSELAFNLSSRFTEDELDDVILGLDDLPPHLNPLVKKNKRLTHFLREHTFGDDTEGLTIANALMVLFDPWTDKSSYDRQYVIFHELSHNASLKLNDIHHSNLWKNLSGWVGQDEKWTHAREACFISRYSKTNPGEDFSETMSAYRYNAENLRKKCPEKYQFFKKNIFKGVEYTSVNKCKLISEEKLKRIGDRLIAEVVPEINLAIVTKKDIEKNCSGNFSTYPFKENEILACVLKIQSTDENQNRVVQIMEEEGVFNSQYNRDEIIESVKLKLASTLEHNLNFNDKWKPVKNELSTIVMDSFLEDISEGFTKKSITENDYIWTRLLKTCGKHYFSGEKDNILKCQITNLLNEDKILKRQTEHSYISPYSMPEIFESNAEDDLLKRREEFLISHLLNHEVAKKVRIIQNEKLKKYVKFHINEVNNGLTTGWQNLSSTEFCRQNYARTFYWLQMFGYKKGEVVPELQRSCEKQQSLRSKRFVLETDSWVK